MTVVISGDTGITFPNGTTQEAAAQLPPGVVLHFANSTAPAGWLACNGDLVSRTTYAGLFNAIGTVYGAGDGATTFKLPDLRGQFLRGWDGAAGVDPGRVIGSNQTSQNLSHTHGALITGPAGIADNSNSQSIMGATGGGSGLSRPYITTVGGTEARPINVAMLPCIKT